MSVVSGSQGRLQNLEQLISVLNRERRNNRLYVTLLGPSPTMVVQDKVIAERARIADQSPRPAAPSQFAVGAGIGAGNGPCRSNKSFRDLHHLRFESNNRTGGTRPALRSLMRIAIPFCRAFAAPNKLPWEGFDYFCGRRIAGAGPALAEHTRWCGNPHSKILTRARRKESLCAVMASFSSRRTSQNLPTPISRTCWLCAPIRREISMRRRFECESPAAGRERQGDDRFESSELAAQALAVDAAGNLFVGTSPDGKVYKVTPADNPPFLRTQNEYIWDLTVDKDGPCTWLRATRERFSLSRRMERDKFFIAAKKLTFARSRSIRAATSWRAQNPVGSSCASPRRATLAAPSFV